METWAQKPQCPEIEGSAMHFLRRTVHSSGASKGRAEGGTGLAGMYSHVVGSSKRHLSSRFSLKQSRTRSRRRGRWPPRPVGSCWTRPRLVLLRWLHGGRGRKAGAQELALFNSAFARIYSGPNRTERSLEQHRSRKRARLVEPHAGSRTSRSGRSKVGRHRALSLLWRWTRLLMAWTTASQPFGVPNPNCVGWRWCVMSLVTVASSAFATRRRKVSPGR